MVLFTKCCYCFRLNTAGLLLGWLGIIASLGVLYKTMDDYKMEQIRFISQTPQEFYIVTFVVIGVYLAACVALLNGCRDLNHYLLLPWMICEIAVMVYGMTISLHSLTFMYSGEVYYTDEKLAINVLNILLILLRVYWWLCVESYYEVVRKQQRLRNTVQFPEEVAPVSEKLCDTNKMEAIFII